MTQSLLIELGTEELPPTSLAVLAQAFSDQLELQLDQAALSYSNIQWYATPRRLALSIKNLAKQQPDKILEKRGPAVNVAFDANGEATKAAQGWAQANGISIEQAERLKTDKGEWLLCRQDIKGQQTVDLIIDLIRQALTFLPIHKPMRWGNQSTEFIRPVKTLCVLIDDQLIDGEILGIKSSRSIRGHRFMGEKTLNLSHADDYLALLEEKGKVIADYTQRKAMIINQIELLCADVNGYIEYDEALIEEVTSLVEWPVALMATFDSSFLNVPSQALVHTMKGDQKYFPIYDLNNSLMPYFIFISNIESTQPEVVIAGNEKVIRPRLADAEFFFNNDRKRPLIDRLPELSKVIFQKQLGTVRDKTDRITWLALNIAEKIGADKSLTQRAAQLSKCDLMTSMVFEFTETQGVMGMHYALHDGEDENVAQAINDHYLPRFAGDDLPSSDIAAALAIADKLDTIVGIFAINQAPKGSDPFALRRNALGILRIIVERQYSLDLVELIEESASLYEEYFQQPDLQANVLAFILGRFRSWYQDQGIPTDCIQAVLARNPTKPIDFDQRVKAVAEFRTQPDAQSLAAANKRVSKILAKHQGDLPSMLESSLLVEAAEQALAQKLVEIDLTLAPAVSRGNYQGALCALAQLNQPINDFFDQVMVMAEDDNLRNNRLVLLNTLRQRFLQIADISVLQ